MYRVLAWVVAVVVIVAVPVVLVILKGDISDKKLSEPVTSLFALDEGYGTSINDREGLVAAGTITNAAWKTPDLCKTGNCLFFDGAGDYVSFTDDPDLDFAGSDSFTLEGWFRHAPFTPVIDIDHEEGNTSEYTSLINPDGDLTVTTAAAQNGTNYGLTIQIDDTASAYGRKDITASTTGIVRYSFYIDPNSLAANEAGDEFTIVNLYNSAVVSFGFTVLEYDNGNYKIRSALVNDAAVASYTSLFTISDAPHHIEAEITRSSTDISSNGTVKLWIDGVFQGVQTGVDNYDRFNDFWSIRVGAVDSIDDTLAGTFYIDELIVHAGLPQTTISKYETSGADGGYKMYMENDGDIACGIDSDNTGFPSDSVNSSSADYDDNRWHHFACVKDGSDSLSLYLDGQLVSTDGSITSSTLANDDPFYIGVDGDGVSNPFTGFIDQVKIFRSARTASEIKSDVLGVTTERGSAESFGGGEKTFLSDGLVGYWRMDEATGDAADSSGNGTTLTNQSSVSYTTGKFGNSPDFVPASTDYFSTATDINGIQTISFWVYPDSVVSNYFISFSDSIYISVSSGTLSATGFSGTFYVNGAPSSTLTASTWQHVTFVTSSFNAADTYVGRIGTTANYADGRIDEIRLYNRALSSGEVANLYTWAPGPVGWWKLDENQGGYANDSSGNGNTGTLTNSPIWVNGRIGSGLLFNSSSPYVAIDDDPTLDMTSSVSIEAWIKRDASGFGTWETIIDKGGDPYWEYWFGFSGSGYLDFMYNPGDSDDTDRVYVNDSIGHADTSSWHHVAATYDSTGSQLVRLYFDGVLVKSESHSDTIYNGAGHVTIGSTYSRNGSTTKFNGSIDDVKIFNYARTQAQIIEDMNAGHPAPAGGAGGQAGSAVAEWNFDEGTGTTAHDGSGKGNDLTLNTASWTTSGRFGKAWNGTGGNIRLSRATDPDLEFAATEDFALTTWFKSDNTANPAATEYIMANGGPSGSAGYAVYATTNGYICFGIDDDTSWGPDVSSCTATDYYDGSWHHVAGIRNVTADTISIYVDGILKDSDTDTTTATLDANTTFYIGDIDTDNAASGEEFAGDIDETRVFRSVLTQDQIRVAANQGVQAVFGAAETNAALAYDSFTRANGAVGSSEANGPAISRAWESGGSTWTVSGNTAINTPNLGAEAETDGSLEGNYTGGLSDVLKSQSSPVVAESADARTGSKAQQYYGTIINSGIYQDQAHFTLTTGTWYRESLWYKRTVTDPCSRVLTLANTIGLSPALYPVNFLTEASYTQRSRSARSTNGSTFKLTWLTPASNCQTDTIIIDDLSIKPMDISELIAVVNSGQMNVSAAVNFTLDTNDKGHPGGIVVKLDNPADPQNFMIAYVVSLFGGNHYIYLDKVVSGSYTNLITTTVTYTAGAPLKLVTNGTQVSLYYNGTQVGATQTVTDAGIIGNTRHGMFSTYEGNSLDNFLLTTTGTDTAYCPPGGTDYCNPPVAEWKMDEGTGTTISDSSGNGNTSSVFTGDVAWTRGKTGKGLTFDGNDDAVRIPETTSTDLGTTTDSFTISGWIRARGDYTAQTGYLVGKHAGSSPYIALSITNPDSFCFQIAEAGAWPSVCDYDSVANDGEWHHVTAVRNVAADTLSIYVDGTLRGTAPDTTTATVANDADWTIGNGGTSYTSKDITGEIDEVRIYNYARTPTQIAWDYNRGAPVVQYALDECTGTTANNRAPTATGADAGQDLTIYPASNGNTATGSCSSGTGTEMWNNGTTGKFNAGLDFDGNDDYAATTTDDLAVLAGHSITYTRAAWGGWVKPATSPTSDTLIHKNNEFRLTTDADAKPQCEIYSGSWQTAAVGSAAISASTWSHVLCTYDGTAIRVYVNGKEVGSQAESDSITSYSINGITLGRDPGGTGYFDGLLDEVKVWNYALTGRQIQTDMNEGSSVRFD